MTRKIRVTVTTDDGIVLGIEELEIHEPICSLSVRLHGPGQVDAHSDADISLGRIEP